MAGEPGGDARESAAKPRGLCNARAEANSDAPGQVHSRRRSARSLLAEEFADAPQFVPGDLGVADHDPLALTLGQIAEARGLALQEPSNGPVAGRALERQQPGRDRRRRHRAHHRGLVHRRSAHVHAPRCKPGGHLEPSLSHARAALHGQRPPRWGRTSRSVPRDSSGSWPPSPPLRLPRPRSAREPRASAAWSEPVACRTRDESGGLRGPVDSRVAGRVATSARRGERLRSPPLTTQRASSPCLPPAVLSRGSRLRQLAAGSVKQKRFSP